MRVKRSFYQVKVLAMIVVIFLFFMGIILAIAYLLSVDRDNEVVVESVVTGSSEADLSTSKEEAIHEIDLAVQQIDESLREGIKEYVNQAKDTIRNAKVQRTIDTTLTTTLEYLSSVTGITMPAFEGDNEALDNNGPDVKRQLSSDDGRLYTPIDNKAEWEQISMEQKIIYCGHSVPVLMDEENTIDEMCKEASYVEESRAWTLPYKLYLWCEREGIEATRGEYITYGTYYRVGKESFFIKLNDVKETYVEVTCYSYGQSWTFDYPKISAEEIEAYNIERGDEGGEEG